MTIFPKLVRTVGLKEQAALGLGSVVAVLVFILLALVAIVRLLHWFGIH